VVDRRINQPSDNYICSQKIGSLNLQQHEFNKFVAKILNVARHILFTSKFAIFFFVMPYSFKLLSTSIIFARTDMSVRALPFLRGEEKFKVPVNGALRKYIRARL